MLENIEDTVQLMPSNGDVTMEETPFWKVRKFHTLQEVEYGECGDTNWILILTLLHYITSHYI